MSRTTAALLGILVLGGAVRCGHLIVLEDQPDFESPLLDALYHHHFARGVAFDDWTLPTGVADPEIRQTPYYRPPAYPLALAATYATFGPRGYAPRALSMLLALLAAFLAMRLTQRATPRRAPPFVAMLAVLLSPTLLYFEGELVAAAPAATALVGSVLLAARLLERQTAARAVAFGALLGVTALLRPNLAVVGLVPVLLLWRRSGWGPALRLGALAAVMAGVMLAPAAIRNSRVAGEPMLVSTNGPITLLYGNQPTADGVTMALPPPDRGRAFGTSRRLRLQSSSAPSSDGPGAP